MGRWKREFHKYQLLEMLKLSDSYLLAPKLSYERMGAEQEFHAMFSVSCVHLAYYKSALVHAPPAPRGAPRSMLCPFPI